MNKSRIVKGANNRDKGKENLINYKDLERNLRNEISSEFVSNNKLNKNKNTYEKKSSKENSYDD